jgi:hypothetical protein
MDSKNMVVIEPGKISYHSKEYICITEDLAVKNAMGDKFSRDFE